MQTCDWKTANQTEPQAYGGTPGSQSHMSFSEVVLLESIWIRLLAGGARGHSSGTLRNTFQRQRPSLQHHQQNLLDSSNLRYRRFTAWKVGSIEAPTLPSYQRFARRLLACSSLSTCSTLRSVYHFGWPFLTVCRLAPDTNLCQAWCAGARPCSQQGLNLRRLPLKVTETDYNKVGTSWKNRLDKDHSSRKIVPLTDLGCCEELQILQDLGI